MSEFEPQPKDLTGERLFELADLVIDNHVALGPIDQQDLRQALIELLALRRADAADSAPVPEVHAA